MSGSEGARPEHGRRESVLGRLPALEVDALLVTHAANVRYLTGFTGSSGWLLLTDTAPVLLTDSRYEEQAANECSGVRIRVVSGGLVAGLAAEVPAARSIAFESAHLAHAVWRELVDAVPGSDWVPTLQCLEELRAVKDDAEIAAIRRALGVAEDSLTAVVATGPADPAGWTESLFAAHLELACRGRGAERMSFDTIVATGPHGALPHARPRAHLLVPGAPTVVDFGCAVGGYCSDITRTVVAEGEMGSFWGSAHEALAAAQAAAIASMAPGVRAEAVDAAARQVLQEHGLAERFVHGLGHGVGIEVHEKPRLGPGSADVLAAGAVVTVEPGVYVPGEGGMRLEDMVVVTETGAERLNRLAATPLRVGAPAV